VRGEDPKEPKEKAKEENLTDNLAPHWPFKQIKEHFPNQMVQTANQQTPMPHMHIIR
jgi:hypothetical protein